jgi:hypothetical protein
MRTYLFRMILFFGAGMLLLTKAKAQNKSLPDFNRIDVRDNIGIQVFIADRHSMYVEAKYPEHVSTDVQNGTLILRNKENNNGDVVVKLYLKELKGVKVEGAAKISSIDTLRTDVFDMELSGAAQSTLIVSCDILKVNATGAADVFLSGRSSTVNVKLSGASVFRGLELVTQRTNIQTSGAAKGKVNVTEFLSAEASGASQIIFSGGPQYKNISINDAGTVTDKIDGNEFNNVIAQGMDKNGDTTKVKIGKKRYMIIDEGEDEDEVKKVNTNRRRRMKSVWGGFSVGVQSFTTPGMDFNMPANYKFLNSKTGESWFFDLNLPELDGQIIRNKLAITTGLGMSWNNVHFDGNNVLIPNVDSLAASAAGSNLSLNKLYTFDINAPLLIKFAPGTKKRAKGAFHIAVGAILHYVATTRVVTETSAGGYNQRVEINDNFNINPFRIDATVRTGYDRIKVFVNYSLTPYFDRSNAPDVRLFSGGITLIGF